MKTNEKLWVFQSYRMITEEESVQIIHTLTQFLTQWEAHGAALDGKVELMGNKFIVVTVNEEQATASGCSIDKLTQVIRTIDTTYQLELLNRLWVSFEDDNGIQTLKLVDFKTLLKENRLSKETWVYDCSVASTEEFSQRFKLPLEKSWASVYLPSISL